jgi:hypothetical protein
MCRPGLGAHITAKRRGSYQSPCKKRTQNETEERKKEEASHARYFPSQRAFVTGLVTKVQNEPGSYLAKGGGLSERVLT